MKSSLRKLEKAINALLTEKQKREMAEDEQGVMLVDENSPWEHNPVLYVGDVAVKLGEDDDNLHVWTESTKDAYRLCSLDPNRPMDELAKKVIRCLKAPFPYGTAAAKRYLEWKRQNPDMDGFTPKKGIDY